ncbi:MAG: crossover junction endodeoxyribonuclease RuvC [Oscillospiraceae bacterium]|jgi:crossover junction endodeoxyribonuclease RuvC|nr:crossover junction endodeoxyribonuclease RuvC [Oscillospiraceae bacterium]
MRILGIDPGYGTTGFGLLEAAGGNFQILRYGVITTPPGMDFPMRLEVLYHDMRELLEAGKPEAMAIEELFFGQNVTTGIGVAQARGVILLSAAQQSVPVFEYKPMQVKQALVGYGNATKHQMMDMTRRLLHLERAPRPDDAADAIAIALCHGRSATSLLARASQRTGI